MIGWVRVLTGGWMAGAEVSGVDRVGTLSVCVRVICQCWRRHRVFSSSYPSHLPSRLVLPMHVSANARCGRIKHKSYRLQGPLYYFKLKVSVYVHPAC